MNPRHNPDFTAAEAGPVLSTKELRGKGMEDDKVEGDHRCTAKPIAHLRVNDATPAIW